MENYEVRASMTEERTSGRDITGVLYSAMNAYMIVREDTIDEALESAKKYLRDQFNINSVSVYSSNLGPLDI